MSKKNKKHSQQKKKLKQVSPAPQRETDDKTVSQIPKNTVSKTKPKTATPAKKPWYKRGLYIGLCLAAIAVITIVVIYFASQDKNSTAAPTENTSTSPVSVTTTADNIEVSDISVTDIYSRSIKVRWITSIPCSGEAHATNIENGSTFSSYRDDNMVTEHDTDIGWLNPETKYKLEILCRDDSGNEKLVEIDGIYETLPDPDPISIAVGDTVPDFSLQTLDREKISLSNFDNKWVIIVFWDMSCSACKEESKYIDSYYNNLTANDIALITINVNGQFNLIYSYMRSQGFSYPVLLDENGEVAEDYTVRKYPVTILIDPERKIKSIHDTAFNSVQEIDSFVQDGMEGS
jgi:peroxiredoxin